jgi:cobalt/nickel transport protein
MTRKPGDLPDTRSPNAAFPPDDGVRVWPVSAGLLPCHGLGRAMPVLSIAIRAGCGALRRRTNSVSNLTGIAGAIVAAALALPLPVSAHFLLEYTTETILSRPGDLPVKLIFWHPFENGYVMEMDRPQAFFMVHRGARTDLSDTLVAVPFRGAENTATAWRGTVPVKRSGDYILVTEPQPYYEQSEDKFIQQITKAFLNRNTLPTDWMNPVGLATEILPLTKPYNVLVGSSFTGQVLSDGAPVPGAEIEIEYMAAEPEMDGSAVTDPVVGPPPGGAMVVYSDANGYFTFSVPRAGHWGFAALGTGPETEHDGKDLSQDAVIWIRAWDME